jgi:hypothetical protein
MNNTLLEVLYPRFDRFIYKCDIIRMEVHLFSFDVEKEKYCVVEVHLSPSCISAFWVGFSPIMCFSECGNRSVFLGSLVTF